MTLPFTDDIHDHLTETLAQVRAQGYDVAVPTLVDWWQIDEFAQKLNKPPHLKVKDAIHALSADVIHEESSGILNWLVAGAAEFELDVAQRIADAGETPDAAGDYLVNMMQLKLVQAFDKIREHDPSTYSSAMLTFRRMFAEFGKEAPYPFNG